MPVTVLPVPVTLPSPARARTLSSVCAFVPLCLCPCVCATNGDAKKKDMESHMGRHRRPGGKGREGRGEGQMMMMMMMMITRPTHQLTNQPTWRVCLATSDLPSTIPSNGTVPRGDHRPVWIPTPRDFRLSNKCDAGQACVLLRCLELARC